jgi:hypothetical protein
MPFIPSGKRARKRAQRAEDQDRLVDDAIARTWSVLYGPGLCLPMCVLLQRVLADRVPQRPFALRLGALNVGPIEDGPSADPIAFDPRHPDGIDAGFHAWLEDAKGNVLDPSILVTLKAEGYDVDPQTYFLDGGREFVRFDLAFVYEELPELELLGVAESESILDNRLAGALRGAPLVPGTIYLDVRWRTAVPRPTPRS